MTGVILGSQGFVELHFGRIKQKLGYKRPPSRHRADLLQARPGQLAIAAAGPGPNQSQSPITPRSSPLSRPTQGLTMIIPIPDDPRTLKRHLRDPDGNLVILQDKICLLRISDPI